MPPVGAYVSASKVMRERRTSSRHGPVSALDGLDPGFNRAVVTANEQFQDHGDVAAYALYDAHQVRRPGPLGHAINDADHPVSRLEVGFEDQGARAVAAADGPHLA